MDQERFRKKVITDLVTHPATLWPVVAGLSALVVAWAGDVGGWLPLAGLASTVAGLGTLATRWLLGSEDIAETAVQAIRSEAELSRVRQLDQLDLALQNDDDPRTEGLLRRFRAIERDFAESKQLLQRLGAKTALDLNQRVERLFEESVASLRRTLDLWQGARRMRTHSGRDSLLAAREKIIAEIEENFRHLASTLDGLNTLELKSDDDGRLARLRDELQESLDVAYRVEERLQSLENELSLESVDPSSSERRDGV